MDCALGDFGIIVNRLGYNHDVAVMYNVPILRKSMWKYLGVKYHDVLNLYSGGSGKECAHL